MVRSVAPVVSSQGTILQRLPGSQAVSQPGQVIRAGGMVMSGAQRIINPGGQVILAAPGQQLVRTSSGQILQLPQTGQRPGGTVVRGPTAGGGGAAQQRVVINRRINQRDAGLDSLSISRPSHFFIQMLKLDFFVDVCFSLISTHFELFKGSCKALIT